MSRELLEIASLTAALNAEKKRLRDIERERNSLHAENDVLRLALLFAVAFLMLAFFCRGC